MSEHIAKAYEQELNSLDAAIARLGDAVGGQLRRAVAALAACDRNGADSVIESDKALDRMVEGVEQVCIRLIALRQPAADDLRLVMTAVRMAHELERIGDQAKNIAKRVRAVCQMSPDQTMITPIEDAADLAGAILDEAMTAYRTRNPELAIAAWRRDQSLDEKYAALFRDMLDRMIRDSDVVTIGTHLLFIAKNIERIGDHATNLAEQVNYLATGRRIEGERPKSDDTTQVVR